MSQFKIYLKSIAVPVIVGTVVGIIIAPFMDYGTLQKPFLSPPGIVFPIVWTILYILMGVSYGILKSKNSTDEGINSIYYLQLAINALWSIFFFVLKWRFFSFIWILLLLIAIIKMIVQFYAKDKVAGLLQIPYLLWVIFASYLNLATYLLNG